MIFMPRGLATLAVAFALAGCANAQAPVAPKTEPQNGAVGVRASGQASWMSPEAKSLDLLYVSDSYNSEVVVYDYKTGRQVGLLTGFDGPSGQCVDAQGDVWITNYFGSQVVEYAHGGTVPLQVLTTDGNGAGCSINPRTGDLAVANSYSQSEGGGDIQIFKNASGAPVDYTNTVACQEIYAPGYDDNGNLYFEAYEGSYKVCELAAHTSAIKPVGFPEKIDKPGSVMWDGRHITISVVNFHGTSNTAIYQAKRHGTYNLKIAGRTILSDSCNYTDALVAQPFLVGTKNTPVNVELAPAVVGANYSCVRRFDRWAYPGGGQPIRTSSAPDDVGGNAVSLVVKSQPQQPRGPRSTGSPCACLYVTNGGESDYKIVAFPEDANGDVPPLRTIQGAKTDLDDPYHLAVDSGGKLYVVNGNVSILVFAAGAKGDAAPVQIISGSATGLDGPDGIAVDSAGNIYVANGYSASPRYTITVYAAGASGDVAPIRIIAGRRTNLFEPAGLAIDGNDNLYVAEPRKNAILVFAAGASGDAEPIKSIRGSHTKLSVPRAVALDSSGNAYTAMPAFPLAQAAAFPPASRRNIRPIQLIRGDNTKLASPDAIGVDAQSNIYVANTGSARSAGVTVYAAGAKGNVAPIRRIHGKKTGLRDPRGLAVQPL